MSGGAQARAGRPEPQKEPSACRAGLFRLRATPLPDPSEGEEFRYSYASGNPIIHADPDGKASVLTPWLWLAWWSKVLVCQQDVEICKLWCYTNRCDNCRPAPRGRDSAYGPILKEDTCKSNCISFCEYETSCWWKTIRRPLLWLGGLLLKGVG